MTRRITQRSHGFNEQTTPGIGAPLFSNCKTTTKPRLVKHVYLPSAVSKQSCGKSRPQHECNAKRKRSSPVSYFWPGGVTNYEQRLWAWKIRNCINVFSLTHPGTWNETFSACTKVLKQLKQSPCTGKNCCSDRRNIRIPLPCEKLKPRFRSEQVDSFFFFLFLFFFWNEKETNLTWRNRNRIPACEIHSGLSHDKHLCMDCFAFVHDFCEDMALSVWFSCWIAGNSTTVFFGGGIRTSQIHPKPVVQLTTSKLKINNFLDCDCTQLWFRVRILLNSICFSRKTPPLRLRFSSTFSCWILLEWARILQNFSDRIFAMSKSNWELWFHNLFIFWDSGLHTFGDLSPGQNDERHQRHLNHDKMLRTRRPVCLCGETRLIWQQMLLRIGRRGQCSRLWLKNLDLSHPHPGGLSCSGTGPTPTPLQFRDMEDRVSRTSQNSAPDSNSWIWIPAFHIQTPQYRKGTNDTGGEAPHSPIISLSQDMYEIKDSQNSAPGSNSGIWVPAQSHLDSPVGKAPKIREAHSPIMWLQTCRDQGLKRQCSAPKLRNLRSCTRSRTQEVVLRTQTQESESQPSTSRWSYNQTYSRRQVHFLQRRGMMLAVKRSGESRSRSEWRIPILHTPSTVGKSTCAMHSSLSSSRALIQVPGCAFPKSNFFLKLWENYQAQTPDEKAISCLPQRGKSVLDCHFSFVSRCGQVPCFFSVRFFPSSFFLSFFLSFSLYLSLSLSFFLSLSA